MMGKFSFKMVGKKFVEYYSISTGHFLVFKYNGASDFRVLIFDMTACEISYPDEETDDVMLDSGTVVDTTAVTRGLSVRTQKRNKANLLLSEMKLKNPAFRVIMRPSYVKGVCCYSILPLSFVNRYLKDDLTSLTLMTSDGHKRLVGCRVYKGHSAQITEGWKMFAEENHLRVGDVCVFEMIKKDPLLKVHIFPKGEATSPTILNMEDEHASSAKQGERVLPIDERHSCAKAYVSPAVNNKALKASNTLKLDHPSFKFVMRSSYARSGYPVPMYFINTYLQGGYNSVRLKVSDGQTWSVRWLDNQYGVQLGSGWAQFVRENNVKERDVCVFELINKKDLCLKFTFSKRWKADDCRSLPSSGVLLLCK